MLFITENQVRTF